MNEPLEIRKSRRDVAETSEKKGEISVRQGRRKGGGEGEKEGEHFSEEHLRILNYRDVVRFAHEHDGNLGVTAIWDKRTSNLPGKIPERECGSLSQFSDSDSIILDLNK